MKKGGDADPRLVTYIKKQLSKGISLNELKPKLVTSGWSHEDISKAIVVVRPEKKKYLMIFAACVVVLVFIIALFISSPLKKSTPTSEVPSPKVIESTMTLNDIYQKAVAEGSSFCDTLSSDSLKNECTYVAVKSEAERTKNPDVCDKISDDNFARSCKVEIVFTEVALTYKEESKTQGQDVIPSNINLCDKLDNEADREACRNPKKILLDCPFGVCYK